MIILHGFGPAFGLPDLSPFVTKAEVLLKLAGLPYKTNTQGFLKAPKGKLPYIDDGGTIVADSTFIRWHIERMHGIDFDRGLSAEQRAIAWAAEKMMEDHLYWHALYWRWMKDGNFAKITQALFGTIPGPLRKLVAGLVRRRMRDALHKQGTGRHSESEMIAIARHSIQSLAALLGDKPCLMGDTPCGADAMLFAMITAALCPHFETPLKDIVASHANLVAYQARMHERLYGPGKDLAETVPIAA